MSLVTGLLNQTINTIYSTTLNKYSDRVQTIVYSNVRCRWEEKTSVIVGKDAQEKVAKINVWILPQYTILEDYEIKKGGKTYKIIGVEDRIDLGGDKDHIRLWLE